MSFLSEIVKSKQKLQQTNTRVTTADGRTLMERNAGQEIIECPSETRSYGFVVDTKPDDVPSLVINNLYIGSQDCASASVIAAYDIRHVLSLGVETTVDANYKHVPCLDLPETEIKPVLEEATPFIKAALGREECVLVHCNAGVSRASMVVIGYLMMCENFLYEDAYKLVKSKRPAIQPNAGFVRQLRSLIVK